MSTDLAPASPRAAKRASTDEHVIRMWLHGKSENTIDAYSRDTRRFFDFAGASLQELRLEDLQAYADDMAEEDLTASTQARKLAAVKSLLTFAHEIGYVPFNVGRAVKLPAVRDRLGERILSEEEVQRLIAMAPAPRNRVMLRLMYVAGLRVSEVTALQWRDVQERRQGGQLTVHGKGEKTRMIFLSPETWEALRGLCAGTEGEAPVFESAKGAL